MDNKGTEKLNLNKLLKITIFRFISALIIVSIILFIPAGSLKFWNAWLFIMLLFIPSSIALTYMFKRDPALLEKRMRTKEKEKTQKVIIKLSLLPFIFSFIIPGLDYKYGWSNVPLWLVIMGSIVLLFGYLMFIVVIRQNSYASRIIEVQKDQKVIDYGLYSVIRHPMYAANILIFFSTPLILGSFYALIPMSLFCLVLPVRILNEEQVLKKGLSGYDDYLNRVKYRLIPFIW